MHAVVVVGGGFAGLNVARALARAEARVTLVDRRNFHLFQPLLYQVATGGLSPGEIASPLRAVLKRQRNATVLLAEMTDLDVAGRRVILSDGELPYDTLVVATGARSHYFGHDEWEPYAPGLKTIEDATEIRRRIFLAFEAAEREPDAARRAAWMTFVVVGGGPTGVELAGALAEIANETLRHDFRHINPSDARIVIVERGQRVLEVYPEDLSASAERTLAQLEVEFQRGTTVTAIDAGGVTFERAGVADRLAAHTVLWAAGVGASELGRTVGERTGVAVDRGGRVVVGPDLTVPGHPELFVIGDLAFCAGPNGKPLPGVAPVAMQQGKYVAAAIRTGLAGGTPPPFAYADRGSMATIGRGRAIADLGWVRFSGVLAWLAWLLIHVAYLIGYENRLLVLTRWAWSYVTWNRGARLITGDNPLPLARR